MVASTFVKKRNTALRKKLFLAIKYSKLQRKNHFRSNYFGTQSFFMSCHFTKVFVYLLIIAALSNFNVFKLIGWNSANTYLFKVKTNTRKKCEICSKLTIKTVGCRSGIFILLSFEHISHLFLLLLFRMNRKNVFWGDFSCVNIITQSIKVSRCFKLTSF